MSNLDWMDRLEDVEPKVRKMSGSGFDWMDKLEEVEKEEAKKEQKK